MWADRVAFLERLDALARVLRRVGLRGATRLGRQLVRRVYRNELSIHWQGLVLTGGIEHRGYLASLRRGEREPGTLSVFQRLVPRDAIVIDVGAYLGVYALLGARLAGAGGRVVALEVDPRTVPFLRRNVVENGLTTRVRVLEAAAADYTGTGRFFLNDGDASGSSLFVQRGPARDVSIVRLDDVLADLPRVDVMKIDVEGAELRVLRGATDVIARSPNVAVICEVNPRALRAADAAPEDFVELFRELGFHVHRIVEPTGNLVELPKDWGRVKYINVLAQRGSRWERTSSEQAHARDSVR
jgi:FkbM family methyltransferase